MALNTARSSPTMPSDSMKAARSSKRYSALLAMPVSEHLLCVSLTHGSLTGSERRRRERNHSIARKDRASDRSIARLADVWFTPCAHTSSSRSSHSTSHKYIACSPGLIACSEGSLHAARVRQQRAGHGSWQDYQRCRAVAWAFPFEAMLPLRRSGTFVSLDDRLPRGSHQG